MKIFDVFWIFFYLFYFRKEDFNENLSIVVCGCCCFVFVCFIVLLFYCFIVLLFYCFIVLLFYCFLMSERWEKEMLLKNEKID